MKYIYTDGCYMCNSVESVPATWSFVITNENNNILEVCTGKVLGEKQDSNRAELTAFLKALQYIERTDEDFTIRTDFEAVYLFANKKNRYRSNHDLYGEIAKILNTVDKTVVVEKVKAHSGKDAVGFINNFVDKVAKKMQILF